jgi:cell shape-determining protein MreC
MQGLGNIAGMVVAPVSGPVLHAARWLAPGDGLRPDQRAAYENEIAQWKTLYQQELKREEDLRRQVEMLSRGSLPGELPLVQLIRQVVGATPDGSGQLMVRAGKKDGVEVNSVAATEGVQLVGRVSEIGSRTCWVRLLTDKATGAVRARIMVDDQTMGAKCSLSPVGGGLLQGRVANDGPAPKEGQLVRLDDEAWPRSSQMLVLGRIERVEPDPVGWKIITVKPTVDLQRVSEVVLRITPSAGDEPDVAPRPATKGGKPGGKP